MGVALASRHVPAHALAELLLTREGACVRCGSTVGPFEIDHAMVPFSVKPIHETWNLQLLCRSCNRKKGANMPTIYVELSKLFPHQQDVLAALQEYPFQNEITGERQAALCWLATASGKTRVALSIPFELGARKTLIVAPGKITAARFNEEWKEILGTTVIGKVLPKTLPVLTGDSKASHASFAKNGPIVVVTVQWLLNRIEDIKAGRMPDFLSEFDTVIIDEGHHMAAEDWQRIVESCAHARVILLTGTPKRHDGRPLPYVPRRALPSDHRGRARSEMLDVAEVTGHAGARYTLRDAWREQRIKHPRPVYLGGRELSGTLEGDIEIHADSIDAYMAQVEESGHLLDPTRAHHITRTALARAFEAFSKHEQDHRKLGKKLTAIIKVRETERADQVAEIARSVGWGAVAYHGSPSGDVTSVTMERRLLDFRDESSEVNCIVQDRMLSEGYNNSSICMAVLLCKMESEPEIEQFFGRGLRRFPGVPHEQTPHLLLVTLDWKPLREKVDAYIKMSTDMVSVEKLTRQRGENGETELRPRATLDEGELYFIDPSWSDYARSKDPVRQYVSGLASSQETKDEIERLIRSGELSLRGYDPTPRTPDAPIDAVAAELAWKQRRHEIADFLFRNSKDIRADTPEATYKALVFETLGAVISSEFPGLKGGFTKNKWLDPEQLHRFLTCDLQPIKNKALRRLRGRV